MNGHGANLESEKSVTICGHGVGKVVDYVDTVSAKSTSTVHGNDYADTFGKL